MVDLVRTESYLPGPTIPAAAAVAAAHGGGGGVSCGGGSGGGGSSGVVLRVMAGGTGGENEANWVRRAEERKEQVPFFKCIIVSDCTATRQLMGGGVCERHRGAGDAQKPRRSE